MSTNTQTFYLPDLGEGLAEAEIVSWYVEAGQPVKEDDPLLSVETAKALVDVPSPYTGILQKTYAAPGEIIPVHSALADFQTELEKASKTPQAKPPAVENDSQVSNTPSEDKATVVGIMNTTNQVSEDHFIIGKNRPKQKERSPLPSPIHRNSPTPMASSSIETLPMTTAVALAPQDFYDSETIRGPRRSMADAMQKSHEEIAAVTLFDQADISRWYGEKDITTMLIAAICEASKAEPRLNAWFEPKTKQLHIHHHVNLGLAVDTNEGLFVPVLQQINRTPFTKIRETVNTVIQEVKNRQASPERFKRATISLSNFGSIAGRYATPMVVPPMVAIVGAGTLFDEPKYTFKKNKTKDSDKFKVSVSKVMPLSLSFDHRAATGGEGARFLKAMIDFLQG